MLVLHVPVPPYKASLSPSLIIMNAKVCWSFPYFLNFIFLLCLTCFFFPSSHMWLVRFTVILAGYPTDEAPQKLLRHLVINFFFFKWVIWILIYLTSTFDILIVLYSHKNVYLIMSLWLPRGVRKLAEWILLWNCHHVLPRLL